MIFVYNDVEIEVFQLTIVGAVRGAGKVEGYRSGIDLDVPKKLRERRGEWVPMSVESSPVGSVSSDMGITLKLAVDTQTKKVVLG